MESALIVRVSLPQALDRLRQRCVRTAALGVPAHVTLLYPFMEPNALTAGVRGTVEAIARAHPSFSFELTGPYQWPDTVYSSVQPEEPFLAIHREVSAAFPDYPIYGRPGFELAPHVTVADGDYVGDPAVLENQAWLSLPVTRTVEAVEVIAEGKDGRWRTVWTAPLAGPPSRMRP